MKLDKQDFARIARNAKIEWLTNGTARFDLTLLTGDFETVDLYDEFYFQNEAVARYALFQKMLKHYS